MGNLQIFIFCGILVFMIKADLGKDMNKLEKDIKKFAEGGKMSGKEEEEMRKVFHNQFAAIFSHENKKREMILNEAEELEDRMATYARGLTSKREIGGLTNIFGPAFYELLEKNEEKKDIPQDVQEKEAELITLLSVPQKKHVAKRDLTPALKELDDLEQVLQKKHKKEFLNTKIDKLIELLEDENEKDKRVTECKDNSDDCNTYAGYCDQYKKYLVGKCDKTCKYCTVCEDTSDRCAEYKKLIGCGYHAKHGNKIAKMCLKTCGECQVPAPPKCSESKYGCCWEGKITKVDSAGSNCPACVNDYPYICKTFKADCGSFKTPGKFMRQHCPKQCNMCSNTCADNPKYAPVCPMWKDQLNRCETNVKEMSYYCKKTCNLC